jgi:3-oxoacyl-[acyl-carrier protein] reductase
MTKPLAGRTALVTGGAGGIGRAICARLAADGATVVLADLDLAAAETAAGDIPGVVHPLVLEVTDPGSRHAAVTACRRLGGADLLVNCAGVLRDARIGTLEPALFRRLTEINLLGPLALTRLVAQDMTSRGRGAVVNLASRAWLGTFGSTAYSTAKGGLVGATRSLALELGPVGVTVNAVAPGFIETKMTAAVPLFIREAGRRMNSLAQGGLPIDVAETTAWLAHPASGAVNGQVVRVCGQSLLGA